MIYLAIALLAIRAGGLTFELVHERDKTTYQRCITLLCACLYVVALYGLIHPE